MNTLFSKASRRGRTSSIATRTRTLALVALMLALSAYPLASISSPGETNAQSYTATLALSPTTANIGDEISVTGTGYTADTEVELVYHTVSGRYEVTDRSEFVGQRYDELTQVLTTVRSDHEGNVVGQFKVPSGYGGPHDVRASVAGQDVSQAGLMVRPTVTMSPSQGPIGTEIELRIEGVDLRPKVNTWQILYDNHYLGFASAVTTDGIAVARFRAAGPVGAHVIQAWNNSYNSTPYLAWDTSPFRDDFDVPETFTFDVTSDPGYLPPVTDDLSESDNPWPLDGSYSGTLALSVDRGTVGEATTLSGSELPANASVELTWWTMVGNRVSGVGFSEEPVSLGSVTTGADGTFTYEMTIPDDLGGNHLIDAMVGDQVVGAVNMMIIPSVVDIAPVTAKAGEEIEIHLKGLGWTTYDNTYTVTYDNAHIGYVCGFSTNGDVVFKMIVTGEPGTHLIDLYPTIYKGEEPTPKTFSVPQLTYAQDHPERPLPAIRLSIEIVE